MTGHANPQRLVDAAVGVRKLNVEYVDSVAECHKLFATGRYAGIPASMRLRCCNPCGSGRLTTRIYALERVRDIKAIAWINKEMDPHARDGRRLDHPHVLRREQYKGSRLPVRLTPDQGGGERPQ